jgi:hypothetical protein
MNILRKLWNTFFGPRWMEIPACDPLNSIDHGTHYVEFVSRHSIAETGLICPVCENEVAPCGDFSKVHMSRLGECIRCTGIRIANDEQHICNKFLIASPDTEHGDDVVYDKTPTNKRDIFYKFVRISPKAVLQRRYGGDVKRAGENLSVNECSRKDSGKKAEKTHTYEKGQIYRTKDGDTYEVMRVNTDDPYYNGWAHVFSGRYRCEFLADPYGKVRITMNDPTSNDVDLIPLERV